MSRRDELTSSIQQAAQPLPDQTQIYQTRPAKIPRKNIELALQRTGGGIKLLDCEGNAAGLLIPDSASADNIRLLADALFEIWDRIQIYVGDLLVAIDNRQYGETKLIAELYKRDPETLYKWKRICDSVTIRLRRRIYAAVPNPEKPLTITHYEKVMALPEAKQEELLIRALREGWSTGRLRKEAGIQTTPPPLLTSGVVITDKDVRKISREIAKIETIPPEKRKEKHVMLYRGYLASLEEYIKNKRRWLEEGRVE